MPLQSLGFYGFIHRKSFDFQERILYRKRLLEPAQ